MKIKRVLLVLGFAIAMVSCAFEKGGLRSNSIKISSWSFIDGGGVNGINKDTSKNLVDFSMKVFNSKVYAIWNEGSPSQVRFGLPKLFTHEF